MFTQRTMRARDIHSNTKNSYRYQRAQASTQAQTEKKAMGLKWNDIYQKAMGSNQKAYKSEQK